MMVAPNAQIASISKSKGQPRIAAVGVASWDRLLVFPAYPELGTMTMVDRHASAAGGTTANTAVALARLGAAVSLTCAVGDDEPGFAIRDMLHTESIDVAGLLIKSGEQTDQAIVVISRDPLDRTIFWVPGAQLKKGDVLDISGIFGYDLVLLDLPDTDLLRFLLDLPAHTIPSTRLLGTLTYLTDVDRGDAFDLALRHDVIVGNERDLLAVTGTWTLGDATSALQHRMPGQNLRAAAISRGGHGCRVIIQDHAWQLPAFSIPVVDPTGAGDAFAAGVAYGLAHRWEWPTIGQFANALGALAIRELGAQSSLPTLAEVNALIALAPSE